MSRSYKKHPIIKNSYGSSKHKKLSNRLVRNKLKRMDYGPYNGMSYKKIYESWEITEFRWLKTERQAREKYYRECNAVDYPDWSESEIEKIKSDFKSEYPNIKRYLAKCWKAQYKRK